MKSSILLLATLLIGCTDRAAPAAARSAQSAQNSEFAGKPVQILSDGAIRAVGLNSFEGIEEPEIIFNPSTGKFRADMFANIVDVGNRTVRMTLRYHPDWWDGDRDLETNKDRQRAEVKGLGPHQKLGE